MPDIESSLKHLMISASAGSGKTYQLARRYAHLLTLGAEPEGIAAMTFTRKAAGEFFNRILRRLAELAEHPESAAGFFNEVEPPVPKDTDYALLLRRVTRRLHRLRLGTLDSFFAGMARCFPLELGLPAGARVMQEDEAKQALDEALEALLDHLYSSDDRSALHLLTEAYKQATFGAGEKTVDATMQKWAADGVMRWEDSGKGMTNDESLRGWGDIRAIWPDGLPAVKAIADVVATVRQSFLPPHEPGQVLLEETLQAVLETTPGMTLPKRVKELLEKLAEQWPELQKDRGELMWMRKKLPLDGAPARALRGLAEALMLREFLVRAERTRGLAAVTAMLADHYAQRVRARGRLSFADVQRLLANAVREDSPWLGGSGDLWYRMDGRHDHWLLDEFQDTSRTQWQVIGDLVDEVIQDTEGHRSFFAVGDPKQSIYLWRQAEPDLFDDVLRAYPEAGPRGLHQQPLSVSYRSAPAVLDAVNGVFGNRVVIESLLPEGSLKGFSFQEHLASQKALVGHAVLLSPLKSEGDDQEGAVHVAAKLLREMEPLKRGLSCAVLVRQNNDATEMTEHLRHLTDMEVVCESRQRPCTDNAVTLALLSVLQLAVHPSDTQALEHLKMTPLWPELTADEKSWLYRIANVQRLVQEQGFTAFMQEWVPVVRAAVPELDEFHKRRLTQMTDIAMEFDVTGSRDLDVFIRTAREYPLRVRGSQNAIQVMTVHAAKGLEFDIVILPDLDGDSMDKLRRDDLMISRDREGVRWVLQTPLRVYAELDETLGAELKEAKRRGAFESLCRLYVAMTRAKRGLYLIAEPAAKKASAIKESVLLRDTLGASPVAGESWNIEWETGDVGWYLPEQRQAEMLPPVIAISAPLGPLLQETQPMPRRRTPSGEESFKVKGSVLFSAGREPGRRLGTRVHELFAEVAWAEPLGTLTQRWLIKGLLTQDDLSADSTTPESLAFRMVCSVLGSNVFQQPGPHTQLWRERPFDLVMEGEWVSGIFDRVHLARDSSGHYLSAWIIDFKTDDVDSDEALEEKLAGYAPQIALYRTAIMKLTGLAADKIQCSLLFTRLQRLIVI
ncbi:MAG: UvrD-helicase domain-containing protein [Prosthecobacter sp.]